MLDVAFFCRVIPLDIKDEILAKRKNTMSESGESLQWKIIEGLDQNLGYPIKLFNYMPIQSFPKHYPDPFVKGGRFSHCAGASDVNLSFNNIAFIKRMFMGASLNREIKKWAREDNGGDKVIICYSLIPEYMNAIKIVKKINPNIVVCAIVADLPEYTVLEKRMNWSTKLYLRWMKKNTESKLPLIDKFVLLTGQMAERLVTHQKYIVMEGIFTQTENVTSNTENREPYILYAGTLHERFGVMNLVHAFHNWKRKDVKLYICGIGDSKHKIEDYAKKDDRIVYWGQLPREQVLQLISNATIIVNPRFGTEEYTKYSFPSKNLEAISSGVPFVAYKLAGIPKEYDDYIHYPADDSPEALALAFEEVLEQYDISKSSALKAREFIMEHKNQVAQTKRILELILDV